MIKKTLKALYSSYKYKNEKRYFDNIIDYIDFDEAKQEILKSINTITFVIPGMYSFSGGHTSILRLGSHLANFGYNINYVSYKNQNVEDMEKSAEINLANFKGRFFSKDQLFDLSSDVYVATMWDSSYVVKKLPGYKMYFVQDYEPYFYPYGEKHILAKKSYELGLHIVTLGPWIKEKIKSEKQSLTKIDAIDFPYEKSEYGFVERNFNDYKHKKEFDIAVYIKRTEKRAPFIIQNMLEKISNKLKEDKNITLNVFYFGEDKRVKLTSGKNLGKLNKTQLYELYKKSDFGMVASLTNISLVPYEMMATCLPIIEFEEGTFKHFFKSDCAILTSFNWKVLYQHLIEVIDNPELLKIKVNNGLNELKDLSWENTAKQFSEIIKSLSRAQ
jgi:glycosyltransferase involved in cell wall biosynthesis